MVKYNKHRINYYYPFGLTFDKPPERGNDFLYNGKELQNETIGEGNDMASFDLYACGARFYDAQLGRFHSVDPLNQYHSPYNYVGNNPINMIDPTGMWGTEFDDRDEKFYGESEQNNISRGPGDPNNEFGDIYVSEEVNVTPTRTDDKKQSIVDYLKMLDAMCYGNNNKLSVGTRITGSGGGTGNGWTANYTVSIELDILGLLGSQY